jgi:hypothetical protein
MHTLTLCAIASSVVPQLGMRTKTWYCCIKSSNFCPHPQVSKTRTGMIARRSDVFFKAIDIFSENIEKK